MTRAHIAKGEQRSLASRRLFTCMNCEWFRDVVSGKEEMLTYDHRYYGRVTYLQAAKRDIATHNCLIYTTYLRVMRGWIQTEG